MTPVRRYTRREAVRLQLEMAVRARLQYFDLVSALTLAGAAERVLSDLQPKEAKTSEGFVSLKAYINEVEPDGGKRKILADQARKDYDQLRHAYPKSEWTHELDGLRADAFITLAIEAFAPRKQGADLMKWLHELPPVLGAFWFFAYLVYPGADTAARKNDQTDADVLNQVQRWKTTVDPDLFDELVGILQRKSLIPNPKSLANPSTER